MIFVLSPVLAAVGNPAKVAAAATANLLIGGTFEQGVDQNWGLWQNETSVADYEFYRSFETPLNGGSYSAIIAAHGTPAGRASAGIVGVAQNSFDLLPDTRYLFNFYAKSGDNVAISAFLEKASDYSLITPLMEQTVSSGEWQRYQMLFSTDSLSVSEKAFLVITFGDMADGAELHIDSLELFEFTPSITTAEIKGFTGEQNKTITLAGLPFFNESDIAIGLPFSDSSTGGLAEKKFTPQKTSNTTVAISIYPQTYSGIGRVYVNDNLVGSFDYNVLAKLNSYHPDLLVATEDSFINVTGINPANEATYLVAKGIDALGKVSPVWIKPVDIDPALAFFTVKLPSGIVNGDMYVQTTYQDKAGQNKINKSNVMLYKVMPEIFKVEWQKKGFEQVGDSLLIYGKGISYQPKVKFYDQSGNYFSTVSAKMVSVEPEQELISVVAPTKLTNYSVTVVAGGIESDRAEALAFTSKPKLNLITSKYKRALYDGTTNKVSAANIGEVITLTGVGFSGENIVDFQGNNRRIQVAVDAASISGSTSIKVAVPEGALSGLIKVISNGQSSNYQPLEIVPMVMSVSPDPLVPGEAMAIRAQGVGGDKNIANITFTLTTSEKITVVPDNIVLSDAYATINLKAPLAISNKYSSLVVQYGNWQSSGKTEISAAPHITSAAINMQTKVLTIRGYGFSVIPSENIITYKYADAERTTISPKVKMLGVYPTENGQEIRIGILDDYHYGYVSVTTGTLTSNEANFGPVSISSITRRVQYVASKDSVMGVLYIKGYNFGPTGGVKVGDIWADVHYRSDFLIIAVVDQERVNDNPVIVAK